MKNLIFNFALLIFSIIILNACTPSRGKIKTNKIKNSVEHFPPGASKIIGTIISVDSTKVSKDSNSNCSKQPCWAVVKIDSVIGFGAGAPIVGKNDILKVKFNFSLGKTTKEFFPNLDKRLPGLKINSKFAAFLKKLNTLNFDNSKRKDLYQIDTYNVLTK